MVGRANRTGRAGQDDSAGRSLDANMSWLASLFSEMEKLSTNMNIGSLGAGINWQEHEIQGFLTIITKLLYENKGCELCKEGLNRNLM
jgi:hypothetical protein